MKSDMVSLERRKDRLALGFAYSFGLGLAVFGGLLAFARSFLSQVLPGGISVFLLVTIGLVLVAWLSTWAFMAQIARIEKIAASRDHEAC